MNKKILSLVLALVMVLGTFSNVFAETKAADKKEEKPAEKVEKIVGKDNKIQYIIDKKLVQGYEDGSYKLDKNITRAEITRLLVLANGNEELSKKLQGSMKIYSDVDASHWANGVITVGTTVPSDANGIAMLAGYPDKSFKPDQDVTYAELAKMLVVLAKKDLTPEMVKNAIWASSWMTWAQQLGILDDVTIADSNKAANRADAFTMVYNALYKMQSFKRVPANAKIGVLSTLKNGKLVLNQDEKEQSYKVIDSTVFIGTYTERELSNLVKVNKLTNPEYYLGSLVRIIVNDKKEVTHILELGNPENMALGVAPQYFAKNYRWEGVAGNTVSTGLTNVRSLKEIKKDTVFNGYAELNLSNNLNADTITFKGLKNDVKDNSLTLRVNDDTKVYVANPYNNIMREVKNINEALGLMGYRNYDGYKIPNVYAGFDKGSAKSAIKSLRAFEEGYAKVIVFNVVTKMDKGTLYRVIESTGSNGSILLENTEGQLFDRDMNKFEGAFPFNHGNKFDVVRYDGPFFNQYLLTDRVVLKASNTDRYPIVKVLDIDKGSKTLLLEGKDKEYSVRVSYADADIFSAKRFDKLEKDSIIQIAAERDLNDKAKDSLSVISILDKKFVDVAGSLKAVFGDNAVSKYLLVGTIKRVDGKVVRIQVRENSQFDNSFIGEHQYNVPTEELAKALETYKDKIDGVKFYATKGFEKTASDFRENTVEGKEITGKLSTPVEKIIDDIKKLVDPKKVDATNFLPTHTKIGEIEAAVDRLDYYNEKEYKSDANKIHKEKLSAVKTKVQEYMNAQGELIKELAKLDKKDILKDVANADLGKDAVKTAIITQLKDSTKAGLDDTKVNIAVDIKREPKDNENYAKGAKLEVTVKLTSKTKTDLAEVAKYVEGNVAN